MSMRVAAIEVFESEAFVRANENGCRRVAAYALMGIGLARMAMSQSARRPDVL
jgi:hypothetical protein